MVPRHLRLSLLGAQLVGAATLLRSIAYDRWITVLASVLLLVGAAAAHRGRAWGVALMFGSAVAFPVAWLIGIAPMWFCLVGIAGALPYVITAPSFARFDRGAAALLTALAASAGAFGALAWKALAWTTIGAFPILMPSAEAHHGFAIAILTALGVIATRRRLGGASEEVRVRVAENVRVAASTDAELEGESEVEVSVPRAARRAIE